MIEGLEKQRILKDFVYWIAETWEEVKPMTLQKSWRKILTPEQPNNEASDDESFFIDRVADFVSETFSEEEEHC